MSCVCTCAFSGPMSDPDSMCPFDLLDVAMRDPFLKQAFRQLDQRHLYGIIARVCRSWNHLSTTSSSSLKVKFLSVVCMETGQPDAAISFSRWLQRNIGNLTRLDLTSELPNDSSPGSEMLQTIISATHLCSLRLDLRYEYLSDSYAGLSALTTLTSLALCNCQLSSPVFSSMLALTQLRALELRQVGVIDYDEGQEGIMSDLTSSLVNLRRLTLGAFSGWVTRLEEGLLCLRSLTKLVDLDIRGMYVPSDNLGNLIGGLPVTGVHISLDDPGHVSEVAGWLDRCVPSTGRCLKLSVSEQRNQVELLQSSQVARLLSPLRSGGAQLQVLYLSGLDLSRVDSVNIITGLTQLTSLSLFCKFRDNGWALLEPAFAHLDVFGKERLGDGGMS